MTGDLFIIIITTTITVINMIQQTGIYSNGVLDYYYYYYSIKKNPLNSILLVKVENYAAQ